LDITTSIDESVRVMVVAGELDLSTSPLLGKALRVYTRSADVRLLVDLSGVTFMDSTGLAVILAVHADVAARGGRPAIVCPNGPVRLLFEVAGVQDELSLCFSRADAERVARAV
jgi:anti-anti-sigma factor